MRLAAVDRRAAEAGLIPGHALADARALVPDLELREIDHDWLAASFGDFADWHSNASPIVAVVEDIHRYGDLALDIFGVAHLFGGERAMLDTLTGRLRRRGYAVEGAIAPSLGAAWALAHFAPGTIVSSGREAAALAELPIAGLRLDEGRLAQLEQLGLKQIGQLYGRDRKALAARFGSILVTRLDQALGHVAEKLNPRLPAFEASAERRFAEPIGYIDDVMMAMTDLAVELSHTLGGEGLGAQAFHLLLYRVDHKLMRLSVNAARATREPAHIAELFRHRAERLEGEYDAGFGIDMIRLMASSLAPLDSRQLGAFAAADGAEDLDRLFDRMASRLGPQSVLKPRLVNSHVPERAVALEPAVAARVPDPLAELPADLERPVRLLPDPEPVEVIAEVPHGPPMRMVWRRIAYRIMKASGPERIEAEWWESGRNLELLLPPPLEAPPQTPTPPPVKPGRGLPDAPHVSGLEPFRPEASVRDYYIVEDDGGRRFWVFRIGLYVEGIAPRWFLHGIFA